MKKNQINVSTYSPICQFNGWEINKVENEKLKYREYFAYFMKDKSIKIKADSLKKIKSKILGINLRKGVC